MMGWSDQAKTTSLRVVCCLVSAVVMALGNVQQSWAAEPSLKLGRGICIDRQVHCIPPTPDRTVHATDVPLVKAMGFEFVKYIGWSYWSFNEDYSAMTSERTPSGPADKQTPDRAILHALMPDKYPSE